ncbi:hypothetical protein [Acidocella sp. MX-AZ02]|nr:hypothetical protein [Acidocella sp. MX-AZ02]
MQLLAGIDDYAVGRAIVGICSEGRKVDPQGDKHPQHILSALAPLA